MVLQDWPPITGTNDERTREERQNEKLTNGKPVR
jgi:hypothetical protein